MDAGVDINTFLLSWLCCVEHMAVERHEFGERTTQNVDRLFKPQPTGKLGVLYVQLLKESITIPSQHWRAPHSVYYYEFRPLFQGLPTVNEKKRIPLSTENKKIGPQILSGNKF